MKQRDKNKIGFSVKTANIFLAITVLIFLSSCVTINPPADPAVLANLPKDSGIYLIGNPAKHSKTIFETAELLGTDISGLKPIINRTGKVYCSVNFSEDSDSPEPGVLNIESVNVIGIGNYNKSLIYGFLKKDNDWVYNAESDLFNSNSEPGNSLPLQFWLTDGGQLLFTAGGTEITFDKGNNTGLPPAFSEEIFIKSQNAEWLILIAKPEIIFSTESFKALSNMPVTKCYFGFEESSDEKSSDNKGKINFYGKFYLSDKEKVSSLATGLRFFFFSKSRLTANKELKSSFTKVKIVKEEDSVSFNIVINKLDKELLGLLLGEKK